MPSSAAAEKLPTHTSVVYAELFASCDFRTVQQLADKTGLSSSAVGTALSHLRRHHAVDRVMDNGPGTGLQPQPKTTGQKQSRYVFRKTTTESPSRVGEKHTSPG
jgi:predicted ArsR family transcriptional regulator